MPNFVHSQKLTASLYLKMDDWKTMKFPFGIWEGLFSGAVLVSGGVTNFAVFLGTLIFCATLPVSNQHPC